VFNIGNSKPVPLLEYIAIIERCLGKRAILDLLPIQPGDVPSTMADVSALEAAVDFRPRVSVEEGVAKFVEWYLAHYRPSAG
jgi:UDP-glucuronate 4-epimerase